jgi:hypothetical protein
MFRESNELKRLAKQSGRVRVSFATSVWVCQERRFEKVLVVNIFFGYIEGRFSQATGGSFVRSHATDDKAPEIARPGRKQAFASRHFRHCQSPYAVGVEKLFHKTSNNF